MSEAKSGKEDGVATGSAFLDQVESGSKLDAVKTTQQDALVYDKDTANAFAAMYTKNNGDTDAIFEQLGEDPYKVKKYPPKDAEEFGRKYAQGFYEYIGKAEAKGGGSGSDSKSSKGSK